MDSMNLRLARFSYLAALALALSLAGCVADDDVVENPTDDPAAPEGTAGGDDAGWLAAGAPWCPPDTSYDATYRWCASATEAVGPFTPGMEASCRAEGGGDACAGARWSASFARSVRGTGRCPPGATLDLYLGYCFEGPSVYGPFGAAEVQACRADGGGAPCEGLRWSRGMLGGADRRWIAAPYAYQYFNQHEPGATCGVTSASMVLRFWGKPTSADQLYVQYGKSAGQSPEGLVGLYQALGLTGRSTRAGSFAMIKRQLDAGRPVIVHGWFTAPGHILVVVGYNPRGFILNDPAGLWRGCVACGYDGSRTSTNGNGALYTYGQFRAAVGADGDIWLSSASSQAFAL